MHIECFNNSGKPYLRLVRSVMAVSKKSGKRYQSKKTVKCLGPLERFDDGRPDYLKRLRESFKAGHPLIPALEPYAGRSVADEDFRDMQFLKPGEGFFEPINAAPLILDKIFAKLGLEELCAEIRKRDGIEFDLEGRLKQALYKRLLCLGYEEQAAAQAASQDNGPSREDEDPELLFSGLLNVIHENKERVLTALNAALRENSGQEASVFYASLTDLHLEDDDEEDYAAQPLLITDSRGLPVAAECLCISAEDRGVPDFKQAFAALGLEGRLVLATSFALAGTVLCALEDAGCGYIMERSPGFSSPEARRWAADGRGYQGDGDFKYKARVSEIKTSDKDGKSRVLKQKSVACWDRGAFEQERAAYRRQFELLLKIRESRRPFKLGALDFYGLKKFLRDEAEEPGPREKIDSVTLRGLIDQSKTEEFMALLGKRILITGETDASPRDLIERYQSLRDSESELIRMLQLPGPLLRRRGRSLFQTEAYLLLCALALILLELIKRRTGQAAEPGADGRSAAGSLIDIARIREALSNFSLEKRGDNTYRFGGFDEDMLKIAKAFGLDPKEGLWTEEDLARFREAP